jgi:hypothetical protein
VREGPGNGAEPPASIAGAVQVKARYQPRPEWQEHYARLGEILAEVYEASRPGFLRLREKEGTK